MDEAKKQKSKKTMTPSRPTGSLPPPAKFRSRLRRTPFRNGRPGSDATAAGVKSKSGSRRRGAVSDASRAPAAAAASSGSFGARGLFFRRKVTATAAATATATATTAAPPHRRHRCRHRRRRTTGGRRLTPGREVAVARRPRGVPPLLRRVWRTMILLDGCCEATWVGKASAHVLAGALASSHSVMASMVVGLALWVSCTKRLTGRIEDDWKQVAR